ncbi:DNA-directed RNA polymerases I, II, and III subunit RPABC3 [Ascosphaera pollenicola]|nr:DNA-directed RNA polymerases I, II, and III subunit RPABC3 [Ascosphaera pollenicola]
MLDCFEIVTTSGVVLWSKTYAPIGAHIINGLINDVFIEEKLRLQQAKNETGASPAYKREKYTLKWRRAKNLGLIFVAVYHSMLHLTWVEQLLDNILTIFVDLYKSDLSSPHAEIREYPFDQYFEQQIRELESASLRTQIVSESAARSAVVEQKKTNASVEADNGGPPPPPPIPGLVPVQQRSSAAQPQARALSSSSSVESSPTRASTLLPTPPGPGGRASRRARKAAHLANNPNYMSSGDESAKNKKGLKKETKKMRTWGIDGVAMEDAGNEVLDYSTPAGNDGLSDDAPPTPAVEIDASSAGVKTKKGEYVLRDLGDEVHSILDKNSAKQNTASSKNTGMLGSGFSAISGYFRNVVGGHTLTHADLEKPLRTMEDHLVNKNVAREATVRLCQDVEEELVGKKTGSFQSIESALRAAMETSLRKILTPTTSLDLLHEIRAVTQPSNKSTPPRPYVISIVGVNGVGKSTNLSKICFFLLQNNYRVLIAACDTFRSGAVEQLRVHARNLKELSSRENVGSVELYEKGYGKDAANVAKDAVSYAATNAFDVVLIDTAGRRHNDQRLMSSLEKFAKFANPDKIFMVGEALVGTDSVMQARNFNQAFGRERNLDGFIISKCDTVGNMVGTLVSMVYATGVPVVFLGVGQHYGDLRGLSVSWAVDLLMQ